MYNISEKSKLYSEKNISKEEVYKLLSNDFSQFQIDMLFADKNEPIIETKEVYDFICENKDLTKKEINVILNDDVKLFLRIHTHKGTWYSDDYRPYCGQMQVKCSSPRMIRHEYGNKCPECGNEIGLSGVRLTDSPLNVNITHQKLINNLKLAADTISNFQLKGKTNTDSKRFENIEIFKNVENQETILLDKKPTKLILAGQYGLIGNRDIISNSNIDFKKLPKKLPKLERNLIDEGDLNWIELDLFLEAFKNSETNINFRVDTRDFHCIKSVKDNFSKLSHHTQHTITKYFKRFTYSRDEVINVLQTAFEKSGGEGEWRMLSYIKYPKETNSWQLKYLNVIYVGDKYTDLEGKYIITDGDKDSHRLLNKDMWYTEIDKELLCHH